MEVNLSISLRMKAINEKIRKIGDATFAQYDLTGPQVGYISYIRRAGGSISQRELEKAAGVSHPTIVGIVNRLQDKGYVTVRIGEKDKRKRIISLTEKAIEVNEELRRDYEQLNTLLFEGMTSDEKQEFDRFLKIIDTNLSDALKRKECKEDGK